MSRCAKSLLVLLDEVNAANPKRDKASDGGIGDPAHAARASSHNPDSHGVYRARDFDRDGIDADALAEHIRQLGLANHPALGAGAYVIWNRRICSDARGWVWRPYDGTNPHTKHIHVSCTDDPRHYDDQTTWGWQHKTPAPVAATPAPIPREDDDMPVIIGCAGNPALYVSDYITKRHVADMAELKELLALGLRRVAVSQKMLDAMPERKL